MIRIISILIFFAGVTMAQDVFILPVETLAVVSSTNAAIGHFNAVAELEAGALGRLTRHKASKETLLFHKINRIRAIAKKDPVAAEIMAREIIEQFKKMGVNL